MCGIAGIYSPTRSVDRLTELASKMSDAIMHRGPDDSGIWLDKVNNLALSHRRLSIIDTSNGGHQPMTSRSTRYTIVFNGEIYNYRFLRRHLEENNRINNWQGGSDTEVLLEAISAWGLKATLEKVEGMFAFALWDNIECKLYLARDRFGEKPLYYGNIGKDFVFGSELKALRIHPDFNSKIDRESIAMFLQYSHVPAPRSIFQNVFKLPPANFLCVDFKNNQKKMSVYWTLESHKNNKYKDNAYNKELILSELHAKLNSSVADQMVADVPVGAFLSGGIDSSLIVALMQQNSLKPVHTFSVGFSESEYDESNYARAVANHLGTEHKELIVSPSNLIDIIPLLPTIYDEPFADSSQTPTFLVSKLARNDVTVAITGDGGDEVFGGYNRHIWANSAWNAMNTFPNWFRRSLSVILSTPSEYRINKIFLLLNYVIPSKYRVNLPGQKIHKVANTLSALNVEDLYECLTSLWKNSSDLVINSEKHNFNMGVIKGNSSAEKMMFLDLGIYLPGDILTKVDRASMGVSLETRVPFLNHKVVEYAWNMPIDMKIYRGEGKWALRRLLEKYIPIQLINRPKMGFGVPIDSWLRGALFEWSKSILDENTIRNDGLLKYEAINKIWIEHQSGNYNHEHILWNILMFQIWLHNN
jgi:asparagine synthase (glutamine-hydrolysing)